MAICDDCKAGYHIYCLEPKATSVPDEDWHCPRCLVISGEFGFQEGGIYSLKEFQEIARTHKQKHFRDKLAFDPIKNEYRQPSEEDVEREFWRLTESLDGQEPVEYGADIHSTTHGSGFPTMERDPYNHYSKDPWNLNNLPLDKESLFRHIKTDICGMTVPWLYVGMCFSTFCWHAEDHYTYSANYQHFGATKTWYGIPAEDADRFEEAMREAVPELFEQQPDLLFQLVTLLQPEKLKKAGVRVYALDQRAGQFVITFPRAYHAGFNHGFNFNEAVNFAPYDWEPFGQDAIQRLQSFRRQPVFSHDELLFSAASRDHTIKTAKWLGPALQRTLDREMRVREAFADEYRKAKVSIVGTQGEHLAPEEISKIQYPFEKDLQDIADEETVCAYCKCYGFLSRFKCDRSKKVLCLLHAGKIECCDRFAPDCRVLLEPNHTIHLRLGDNELQTTVQKVVDLSNTPDAWEVKLDKLLAEGPNPPLKTLKALLTEGEKINFQWELPALPDLKRFVEKCNDWVEEATNYITRKQQNRRKNERAWRKSSTRNAEIEERERELRNVDNIKRLLQSASQIGFDCPELETLRERDEKISDFRKRAKSALSRASTSVQELEDLIEEGKNFSVDMPEVETLEKKVRTVKWYEEAQEHITKGTEGAWLPLEEVAAFIQRGKELGIQENQDGQLKRLIDKHQEGLFWEESAKGAMATEEVNYQQLDALSKQACTKPVSRDTLTKIDAILQKQRDAQDRISALYERTKDPELPKRPPYKEVVEAMEALEELNSKPPGTLDLEKEQKRHEDWMRRGKKLFGKTNAPLHILLQHLKYVEERNDACLDLRDQPRMPVEPSSRQNTPEEGEEDDPGSSSVRDVFCLCRKPEAGMMIECEMCHEWYHTKCLKIARGKVKEDDKYTCPICDYRVKIPRDATRPKLEELEAWQDEIPGLPFQPEEEETLKNIIDVASAFRAHVAAFLNPMLSTPEELPQQRFYLRKIEGAEVLLSKETNFFRQEVHKWAPVAPVPPPVIDFSASTRKPRPTKLQKQMKEMGITDPNDLPEHLRPKPPGQKKKAADARKSVGQNQSDVPSTTPPGLPHGILVETARRASDALPTREDRASTFSYDAMAAQSKPYAPNSPMFTSASHSAYNRSNSPPATTGVDPQLENMFGAPSGSKTTQVEEAAPPPLLFGVGDSQEHQDTNTTEAFGALDDGATNFGGDAMDFQHE
jgi:[histone H3]-trimethyl-L-lysine4 demethylase